ncbi:MAG: S8 family serine peptidase, partial [Anaerolineaceae bacterium]|nr:S8 family serine peptidase [Anaerolineaceae bacterium]
NQVLEEGKNPGLGVRDLHAQGITGKGDSVAIIDQPLGLNHPEYKGKILLYKYFDPTDKNPQSDLHGPAVASLLVGTNTGTAPDAKLYYAAVPSASSDAQNLADGLNWIVDTNETLPIGERIRVVSVSSGPSGPGSPFTQNNDAWDAAYERATQAGILVLDCTIMHNIVDVCTLDLSDPENPSKCIPGWQGKEFSANPNKIYVPYSHRSFAETYQDGVYSYQYDGEGGLSWTLPYVTGVLAMGWQVNPNLSKDQMVGLLFDSAYKNQEGVKIINPVAFITKVKETVN